MTRLLIAYDGSDPARAAISAAAGLFSGAQATVVNVHPPAPTPDAAAMARVALPDAMIREGIARMRDDAERRARELADEGVELARDAGLDATAAVREGSSVWREIAAAGREADAAVIVCGTQGEGPIERVLLGSTASSLLHHAERAMFVVPAGTHLGDGPILAGYDGSDGARGALRFAGEALADRPLIVAHAWRSPVRHSVRGRALAGSRFETLADYAETVDTIFREVAEEEAEEGAAYARELGLDVRPLAFESGRGEWRGLLHAAEAEGAAVILIGSRGRGAVASTVLGSVASGLVHAAARPVIVVPGGLREATE